MVKWTDHALAQLRHIHTYIAQRKKEKRGQKKGDGVVHGVTEIAEHKFGAEELPEID